MQFRIAVFATIALVLCAGASAEDNRRSPWEKPAPVERTEAEKAPGIAAERIQPNRALRALGLDAYPATTSQSLEAIADEAGAAGPVARMRAGGNDAAAQEAAARESVFGRRQGGDMEALLMILVAAVVSAFDPLALAGYVTAGVLARRLVWTLLAAGLWACAIEGLAASIAGPSSYFFGKMLLPRILGALAAAGIVYWIADRVRRRRMVRQT